VYSDFRGSISNCVFSGNASTSSLTVGGAISIQGRLDGQIAQNVFSSNRSDSGGAIHLAAADNADAERGVIANNIFFGDHTPGAVTSGALHTEQAVSVLNNTFYGNDTDSHLSVPVSSAACIVRNNIFGNAQNAITQANETPVFPIDHNCFFDVTNILWRDGEGLGTDLYFVGLIVNEFENNIVSAPGFIGLGPASGTFTVAPAYDANRGVTIANVSGVSWETNQWEGAYVNFGTVEDPVLFPLLGNDASTLVLRGNLIPTGLCEAGEEFRIVDLRLRSDSVLIDAGAKVPLARDRQGDVRPQSGAYDIGADEYFTGEAFHSADTDRDGVVTLSELLRIIQLFHREQYRCAAAEGTEDGYTLLPVASRACAPHSADYIRQDWSIGFRELLRVVQLYNAAGYSCCTGGEEGDGFCVEQARLG
jgi:hypothetical protein